MPTPAEIRSRPLFPPSAEQREVIRLFLAVFALDSADDAAAVAKLLGMEDGGNSLWELAQRAKSAINEE
jgi:hypothetical protein